MPDALEQILAKLTGIEERLDKLEQPGAVEEVDEAAWWAAHGRIIGPDGLTDAEREGHRQAMNPITPADRIIELPPPSDEKQERRRMFVSQQLHLNRVLPAGDNGEDWDEVYVKGGPLWLYNTAREIVMTYPEDTRRMMVEDLNEDAPDLAQLMGGDILKKPAEETEQWARSQIYSNHD